MAGDKENKADGEADDSEKLKDPTVIRGLHTATLVKQKPVVSTKYGPDGTLTREGMEATIREGGSVLIHTRSKDGQIIDSQHITRIEDLPSVADLAKGDEAKEEAARAALTTHIQALQAELAKIPPKTTVAAEATQPAAAIDPPKPTEGETEGETETSDNPETQAGNKKKGR